jgi:hypothetical protein
MNCQKLWLVIFALTLFGSLATTPARQLAKSKAQRSGNPPWEGEYNFGETSGRNTGLVILYSVKVYQKDGSLLADIDADGHQTMTRLSCKTKVAGNRLTLYFSNYREENLFEIYKPGEVLLSLERRGGKLLTYWGAIRPQLTGFKNGRVYFYRKGA